MKKVFKILFIMIIVILNYISFVCNAEVNVSANFIGDEKYITYPYEVSKLRQEKAIIKTDDIGSIAKIYVYDDKGKLSHIHLPIEKV